MSWFSRGLVQLVTRLPAAAGLLKAIYGMTRPRFTLGVVGLIVNTQGQVLLAEHVFHPEHPWALPGGWIEANENPDVALRREIREELSLDVAIVQALVVAIGKKRHHHLNIAYLCRPQGEPGALSFEIRNCAWFDLDALDLHDEFQRAAVEHYRSLIGSGSPA